jgi:hypothetical protein
MYPIEYREATGQRRAANRAKSIPNPSDASSGGGVRIDLEGDSVCGGRDRRG